MRVDEMKPGDLVQTRRKAILLSNHTRAPVSRMVIDKNKVGIIISDEIVFMLIVIGGHIGLIHRDDLKRI